MTTKRKATNPSTSQPINEKAIIRNLSLVGVIGNTILSGFKMFAGIVGNSGIDMLHTRMFGNKVYIDLEISVDGNKSLWDAHEVAERVHKNVEQRFSDVKHIMIHVNLSSSAAN